MPTKVHVDTDACPPTTSTDDEEQVEEQQEQPPKWFSAVNLCIAILKGSYHMQRCEDEVLYTDAKIKAQEAVEDARSIIEKDKNVLTRKQNIRNVISQIDLAAEDHYLHDVAEDISGLSSGSGSNEECLSIPFHWVAFFAIHLEMIELFLEVYPHAAAMTTTGPHQHNALHISASQGNGEIVQKIVDECPQAAAVKDQDGRLPIHMYMHAIEVFHAEAPQPVNNAICRDMVRILCDAYPDGLSSKTANGMVPLHSAIIHNAPIEIIMDVIEKYPDALKTVWIDEDYNCLPLHLTFLNRQVCLEKFFAIVKKSNYYGLFFPFAKINPVWKYNTTSWVWVLTKFTDDNQMASEDGRITSRQMSAFISKMFDNTLPGEAYPHIILDAIGRIPLSHLRYLLSHHISFRLNLNLTDDQGRTPLMIAMHLASKPENEIYWEEYFKPIIDTLFKALYQSSNTNPNKIKKRRATKLITSDGRHLLHVAAEEGLPWFGIKEIVEGNPTAIRICDHKKRSGLFPFMLAAKGERCNLSSTFELLRLRPDLLDVLDLEKPGYKWWFDDRRSVRKKKRRYK